MIEWTAVHGHGNYVKNCRPLTFRCGEIRFPVLGIGETDAVRESSNHHAREQQRQGVFGFDAVGGAVFFDRSADRCGVVSRDRGFAGRGNRAAGCVAGLYRDGGVCFGGGFYASETGGAGAIGDYIGRAWGSLAGVGVLGIYVLSLMFSGAGGFTIAVGELAARFADFYFDFPLPWWVGAMAVGVIAWILNLRGAAVATRAQLLIIAVSVIPFLLTAVAAIIHAGANNTLAVFSWSNPHGGDLFGALLFCILLFGGFETAGSLAEETPNPRLNIPLALVGTVGGAALLLVICSYAGTIYYGEENAAKSWGGVMDGYARMADDLLGPWAGFWIRLAVLVDFTATCIGFTVAASRGIFSLARSGLLAKGLASTTRQGAPKAAGLVVLCGALLAVGAGLLVPASQRYETLFVTATAQALLLVLVYTALALGALRLIFRNPSAQPLWRWIIFPLAAIAPGLALYGTFFPFPDNPERFGLFGAFAAILITVLWLLRVRARVKNGALKN